MDWFISWPVMLTICAGGPLDFGLRLISFRNSLGKRNPARFSLRIRWPLSKGATCLMSRNCMTKGRFLAESGFSFSRLLICGPQRHSGSGVQDAQELSNDVERVARRAPPPSGYKGIVRSSAHDGLAAALGDPVPQDPHTPRVNFSGDNNYSFLFFLC